MDGGGKGRRTGSRGGGRGRSVGGKSGKGFRGGGKGRFRGVGGDGSRGGGRGGFRGAKGGPRGGGRRDGSRSSRGGGRDGSRRGLRGKKGEHFINREFKTLSPEESKEAKLTETYESRISVEEYYQKKVEMMSEEEFNEEVTKLIAERDGMTLCVTFPSTLTVTCAADLSNCLKDAMFGGIIRLRRKYFSKTYKCCYIDFMSEAFAKKRLHMIRQLEVDGEKFLLRLLPDKPENAKTYSVEDLNLCELHVNNIPAGTREDDLAKLFSTASQIYYPKRKTHNTDRDYAYILYATKEEAFMVFYKSKRLTYKGNFLRVTISKKKPDQYRPQQRRRKVQRKKRNNPDDVPDVAPPPSKRLKVKYKKKQDADEGDTTDGKKL